MSRTGALYLACWMLTLCPSMVWAEATLTEPLVRLERDVGCGALGIGRDGFSVFTRQEGMHAGGERRASVTLHLPDDLPDRFQDARTTLSFPDIILPVDAVVEAELSILLRWQVSERVTYKRIGASLVMLGGDSYPVQFTVPHNQLYQVEKVEVVTLRCHRAVAECPACEMLPEELP